MSDANQPAAGPPRGGADAAPPPFPDMRFENMRDALDEAFEHHCAAPAALKDRFYSAVTPSIAGDALVQLARVEFGRHCWRFGERGRWAITAPIFEQGELVDLAAFDVDDRERRQCMRGFFAAGLESAMWDAHYHPQRRIRVHLDAWSWLRAECVGVVPVDWKALGVHLLQWSVPGVLADDARAGAEIERRLTRALAPPAVYVQNARAAA